MAGLFPKTRLAAAVVAAVAWTGLIVQFVATLHGAAEGSVGTTIWLLLRFFTVTTNLALAVIFTMLALGSGRVSARWLGGIVLAILLVGIVYGLLLQGLLDLSGGAMLANMLLHKVTSVLGLAWWIVFAVKGRLSHRDPVRWAAYPALYLVYALGRGAVEGRYAYPFINVAKLGWEQVAINAVAIAFCFVLAGHALVAIDHILAKTDLSRR